MGYEIKTSTGRYSLNATFRPQTLTPGGEARARLVRGFGSADWYQVQDGLLEPVGYVLTGQVWSDRDVPAVKTELTALRAAIADAERLYQTEGGADVAYLELLGGAEPLEQAEDDSLIKVTLTLWLSHSSWFDAATDAEVIL